MARSHQKEEHRDEMGQGPEKDEDVPDEMSELEPVEGVEQDPDRIGDPADQDEPERAGRHRVERSHERHPAPSEQQEQHEMQGREFADLHCFENDSQEDDHPLSREQEPSERLLDHDDEDRREGPADQEIDADVVEALKDALDRAALAERVIERAHRVEHDHPEAEDDRTHDFAGAPGLHQEENRSGKPERPSDDMRNGIGDFLALGLNS